MEKINAGFVLDAEDPAQLSNSIKTVYSMSAGERHKLGENGNVYVRSHYDRKKHVDQLSCIFTDVLSKH